MIITYYGLSCFKIQSGDITLVFDLPAKKSGIAPPRFHADIAIQSHDHAAHNGAKDLPAGKAGLSGEREKETFLIDAPGEYEVKGVYVKGLKTYHDPAMGKKYGINTAYIVQLENIKLCFLGDYGEKELRPEVKEGINKIDILFLPIGGDTVLEPEAARNLTNQLEPAIVIPMHYTSGKKKDLPAQAGALKSFLAEFGQKDVKPMEKFSIKKKDISEDAGKRGAQVVVLEKQGA